MKNRIPKEDDSVVQSIRDEGAIVFCKTNTPEFGAGANTKNKVYGATCNPFDLNKTPAGSSGGSAAALATNMMPLANGSDYGGSLRQPAAFCGITGLKPTYGSCSCNRCLSCIKSFFSSRTNGKRCFRYLPFIASSSKLKQSDPFSSLDALSMPDTLLGADLSNVKMAFSSDLGCAPVDNEIRSVFKNKINTFKQNFFQSHEDHPDFLDIHNCFEVIRGFNFVASHKERFDNNGELAECYRQCRKRFKIQPC